MSIENKTEFNFLELLKAPFEALANIGIGAYNLFGGNAGYYQLSPWVNITPTVNIATVEVTPSENKSIKNVTEAVVPASPALPKADYKNTFKRVVNIYEVSNALRQDLDLDTHNVRLQVMFNDTNGNGRIDLEDNTDWNQVDKKSGAVQLNFGNEFTLVFSEKPGTHSDAMGYVGHDIEHIRNTAKKAVLAVNSIA